MNQTTRYGAAGAILSGSRSGESNTRGSSIHRAIVFLGALLDLVDGVHAESPGGLCKFPAGARALRALITLFDRGLGSLVNWKAGRLVSAALEANVRRADNRRHPADLASRESSFAICLTYSSVNCAFASAIVCLGGKLAFWLIVITPFILINNVLFSLRLGLLLGGPQRS